MKQIQVNKAEVCDQILKVHEPMRDKNKLLAMRTEQHRWFM